MSARPRARLFILLLIGLIVAPSAAVGQSAEHPNAPSAGQARQAFKENRPLAKNGDASAQYNMGVLYDRGYGVQQDAAKARRWYEKAAAQHYGRAEHNLGIMYEAGKGVPRDPNKAAHWFRRGAGDGQAASQNNLAVLYMKGEGVPQNTGKAAFWAARAAAAGNGPAIDNLPRIIRDLPHIHANAEDVNVHDQPNREARVVRHLDSDRVVVVLARRDSWTQVLLPKSYTIGWVADSLVSESQVPLAGESSPQPAPAPKKSRPKTIVVDKKMVAGPDKATPDESSNARPGATQVKARRTPEPAVAKIVRTRIEPPTEPRSTGSSDTTGKTPSKEIRKPARSRPETPASAQPPDRKSDLSMVAGSAGPTRDQSDDAQPKSPAAKTARVGVDVANVRAGPTGGARIVGQLDRGDKVQLLDERNGWRRIHAKKGLDGWIAGYLLVMP